MNLLSKLKKPLYFALAFTMLLQNTAVISLMKPEKAKAMNVAEIAKIAFITSEQTIEKNTSSGAIEFQTQDINGNPVGELADTTFTLTTDSSTGSFSLDGTFYWCTNNCPVTIKTGQSNALFYYKDSSYGDFTLTSTSDSNSVLTDSQVIHIKDTTVPTSNITSPLHGHYYKSLTSILGTASDNENGSGLDGVKIKIKNSEGNFFDDSTDTWVPEITWLDTNSTDNWNNWSYPFDDKYLTSGEEYQIFTKAIDNSGNTEPYHSITFNFDNVSPTGSIVINDGADATNGDDYNYSAKTLEYPKVKLDFTYTDDSQKYNVACIGDESGSGIVEMMVSNNKNLSPDGINEQSGLWIDYQDEPVPWNVPIGDGQKTVYVQFRDQAGNLSPIYSDSIFYSDKNEGEKKVHLASGTNLDIFDETKDMGGVEIDINTTSPVDLFYSVYESNPLNTDSGIKFLNKFYDFNASDPKSINFPVSLKIYFTQEDLDDANLTIDQIQGLFFWSFTDSKWELYSSTGVSTSDKAGYVGYVWAELDHFTPMTIGGDVTPPAKVLNLKADSGDSQIKLTWDKLADAAKYEVRYRKSTSDDSKSAYSDVYTLTDIQTQISNLTNDIQYEFNVRAIDSAGNAGEWAIVVATPHAASAAASSQNSFYGSFVGTAYAASSDTTSTSSNGNNGSQNSEINNGNDVKGAETSAGDTETKSARTAITIGIIIIAIGAALGGYYGYQWWIAGSENKEEKDDKPEPIKPKEKKTNRRW